MSKPATPSRARPVAASSAAPLAERVLFYALLAVLCARPLLAETFDRLELTFLAPILTAAGPTPATTVWIDSLLLALCAAAFARRRGARPGGRWIVVGMVMLAAAVVVSTAAAGDKRMAANAGANLFAAVLAGLALVQVMSARWMASLLIAAVLASTSTNAVKCLTQRSYEFADTLEYWQAQKQRLASGGVDVTEPNLINYERRLRSGEAFGYLSHPNVAAACLSMGLLVGAGLLAACLARFRRQAIAPAIGGGGICLTLGLGLWFTGSTGAALATVAGAAALLVLGAARRRIAARPGRATALLAAAYLAVIAAGAGYGLSKGTLPSSSLAFRWQYWTAAVKTLPQAPLTGIGRGNFATAFMRHKSPESPEEVRNPHNFWLTLLVELGPLGLAAGILLSGACVFGSLRRLGQSDATVEPHDALTAGRLLPAVAATLLVQALLSGTPLQGPAMALLWSVELAGTWTVVFLLSAWLARGNHLDAARSGWIAAGLTAALLAALIHNLVGFALLTPAGVSLFALCAAAVFGLGPQRAGAPLGPAAPPRRADTGGSLRPVLAACGTLAFLAHFSLVSLPTTKVQHALDRFHAALASGQSAAVWPAARRVLAADRWDAAAARTVARGVLQSSVYPGLTDTQRLAALRQARQLADSAVQRDPNVSAAHRLLATIAEVTSETYINLAKPDEALAALRQAAEHWDAAVACYPSSPRLRLSAGNAWFRLWGQTGAPAAARDARAHLRAALAIDRARAPHEVRRLRPQELARIGRMLGELQDAGFGEIPPPASQPE